MRWGWVRAEGSRLGCRMDGVDMTWWGSGSPQAPLGVAAYLVPTSPKLEPGASLPGASYILGDIKQGGGGIQSPSDTGRPALSLEGTAWAPAPSRVPHGGALQRGDWKLVQAGGETRNCCDWRSDGNCKELGLSPEWGRVRGDLKPHSQDVGVLPGGGPTPVTGPRGG